MISMPNKPTTIFNFEAVLDEILAVVNGIASDYVTAARFGQILDTVSAQGDQINALSDQLATLINAVSNLTDLWEALIAELSNVATVQLQNQEIALLQQIIGYTATTKPVKVGIDLTSLVTTPQPVPKTHGP
jgi:ABC-type transporter Mla subunit MlaD